MSRTERLSDYTRFNTNAVRLGDYLYEFENEVIGYGDGYIPVGWHVLDISNPFHPVETLYPNTHGVRTLIGGLGVALVAGLGITAWSWWYLAAIIPTFILVCLMFGYVMCLVLLPVAVFFQSYSLKYLGYVAPDLETI